MLCRCCIFMLKSAVFYVATPMAVYVVTAAELKNCQKMRLGFAACSGDGF